MKTKLVSRALVVCTTGLLIGCTTSAPQEATHRWVSTENSSSAAYRVDNNYCRREIAGDSSQREFAVDSPEYQRYTNCMKARGYALTAYNDNSTR